jgi:hypothetical protein
MDHVIQHPKSRVTNDDADGFAYGVCNGTGKTSAKVFQGGAEVAQSPSEHSAARIEEFTN